jgi:general secretion pathway protein D
MKWANWRIWIFFIFSLLGPLRAEDLMQSDIEGAEAFNERLSLLKIELSEKFSQVNALAKEETKETEYKELLAQVRLTREKIRSLEEKWRKSSVEDTNRGDEPYAMWDVGETTLSQLIMEYGASDFLYVIPQELSGMKISLFSGIPLPHESWSEMIEMILVQNGVGVKKLNPFVKQLYILKLDPSAIEAVIAKEEQLQLFSSHVRLFFVFSPPPEQLRSIQSFLERFSDPKQTLIQAIGSKVAIVSSREVVEKLLSLYHAVWEKSQGKIVKIISLTKILPQEAEKILKTVFSDNAAKNRPTYYPSNADELATLVLPQGLVLIAEGETVERAERILADLENQLEDPSEKIIYWYTCKHSNPEDVAEVLKQVYESLTNSGFEKKAEPTQTAVPNVPVPPQQITPPVQQIQIPPSNSENPCPLPYLCPGPGYNPVMPATAPFVQPGSYDNKQKIAFGNFIVDSKTTSILMVVRREELSKIKTLLKKLDVPKRMVQLDVLLVEKKFKDNREIGFNLLQLGTNSSGKKETAVTYNAKEDNQHRFSNGLFSFLFSRPSGSFPAADMRFNFLLTQEDVRIKANPSILAINQTDAKIAIVEEISINNGAFPFNSPTGTVIQDSYTRAQYGITINLTPTIHLADDEGDGPGFVSLQTNLEFDTPKMLSADNRPLVTRRNIKNEVRVADGETVILGGLRQQMEEDTREKIPFLGDLPGLGKLFGTARSRDISTEMFIFITPRIIRDPVDDLRSIRQEEYKKRAGDIPEFLQCIDEAKEHERKKLFGQSLKLLFDMY